MKSIKFKRNLVICSVFFVLGLIGHKIVFNDYDLPINLLVSLWSYTMFCLVDKYNELLQKIKGE